MTASRRQFIAGVVAAGTVFKSSVAEADESGSRQYRKIATEEGFMIPEIGQASAEWVVSEEAGRAGFQAETQVHALRLIMSGLVDRYPDLHLVMGRLGEGIPFFIDRIDRAAENTINHRVPNLKRKSSEYYLGNFVVTTSGMNSPKAVRYCIDVLGIDRVLFALDYPYEKMMPDATALDNLGLPDEAMAKLFHGNAERVFSL